MQKRLLVLFFFITSLKLFAQHDTVFIKQPGDRASDTLFYVIDTILFPAGLERHILAGTTVLPWTRNQQNTKGYGLYLGKVSKSECRDKGWKTESGTDRINTIVRTDTSLTVEIQIYDNCCYEFLCDAATDSTGILKLLYYGYGSYCGCECCFGLTFHFSTISHPNYGKIKGVMLKEQQETLKSIE